MSIGVLALVGVTPERMAALTAAGYAVREGKKYANRIDAVREAGDTVTTLVTIDTLLKIIVSAPGHGVFGCRDTRYPSRSKRCTSRCSTRRWSRVSK
jgi:hypothetical protein